jgi:uncharacterized integral membrane protein (TIGR00698 family)
MAVSNHLAVRKIIFFIAVLLCLTPWVNPPIALVLGLAIAQTTGHPYMYLNKKVTTILLQSCVVGLGFGMNITTALQSGAKGLGFTIFSIVITFALGFIAARLLKVEKRTALLISSGTAICGGSAIAAMSPVVQAEEKHISIALGIVFMLNSIALFIFPPLGHVFHLSDSQFGMWCAIAIHDTSSVVGAASTYGKEALDIATSVKLTRALWIIPMVAVASIFYKSGDKKIKVPYFIGWFLLATIIYTYIEPVKTIAPYIVHIARIGLTLTLFLIGAGLSKKNLRSVGISPFLLGIILWLSISILSLLAIIYFQLY